MIKALAAQIPGVGINESTRMVYFPGGGIVQTKSADNPVSLRGEGLDLAILDECAFIAPEAWGESLRPALSDRQGRAVFISTPNRRNWFHALWIHGTIGEPDWQSWQLPTAANPFIKPEEIEAAKRDLSEDSFRQEYLAQFLQNEGAVFRNLEACLTSTPTVASEHIKHTVVGGIDWGQVKDATAVSLFCIDCRREVFLDRFYRLPWALQRDRIKAIADLWNADLLVEMNSIGGPNAEALIDAGVRVQGFITSAVTKPQLIQSFALALEKEEGHWLPDPTARGELEAFESRISAQTGRPSYGAPEGCHDDTVISRALAWRMTLMAPVRRD